MLVCTTACFTPGSLVTDSLTSAAMSADFTPFNAYMLQTDSIEALEFIHDPEGEHKIKLGYCSSETTTYKELADEAAVDGFHFAADLMRLGLPAGAVGYFYVPVRCRYFGDEGPEEVFSYIQIPADPANVTVGQTLDLMDSVPEDVCAISPSPDPGTSDFTTAEITFINQTGDLLDLVPWASVAMEAGEMGPGEDACALSGISVAVDSSETYKVILYKGKALAVKLEIPGILVTVSGNITEELALYEITGTGTVTFTLETPD